MTEKIKALMDKPAARTVILIMVIVGFAATAISGIGLGGSKNETANTGAAAIEARLCEIVTAIEGAGQTKVMVTLVEDGSVAGVAIVCEGGDNAVVRERITETVKTVLNIGAADVYVTKLMN